MSGEKALNSNAVVGTARPSAKVISLKHYILARQIEETGRRQGELAQILRAATAEREQLATALQGTQRRLAGIAENYRQLLGRLDRERRFRDACRAATELNDLDEMIRRRDELAGQLATMRGETTLRAATEQT